MTKAGRNAQATVQVPYFRFLCICSFSALVCLSTFALDRNRSITQFHHTSWTAKDGAPSQISALAQTVDGYLWIGSARGLFRFDGVEFEPYVPPADVTLPAHNIYALMATPDGGLWISFRPDGLGFLKDGRMRVFSRPEELPRSQVYCFALDPDGRVWAGTQTGLALFDGARWLDIGSDWNFTPQRIWSMFVDRDGTLWVGTGETIVFLPRGERSFRQTGIRTVGVPQITQDKRGRLWMTEWSKSVRTIPIAGRETAADGAEIRAEAEKLLFDRDGGLWMTVGSEGIKRLRFPDRLENRKLNRDDPQLESFTADDGLTGNTADSLFEDREGNVWVSSTKGLDRFRHSHLVPVNLPAGYRGLTLLAGDGGDVWAASASENPLLRITGDQIIKQSAIMEVSSLYHDQGKAVWWGGKGGIWKQTQARFEHFPQPKNTKLDWFWEIFPNSEGGLWTGLGDLGLVHLKDGVWTNSDKPPGLLERVPSASFNDSLGRTWLGYTENRVSLLDGGMVRSFSSEDGIDIGRIKIIRGGRGSPVWFGGELGLAVFTDGRFKTVIAAGEPFGSVSGIVETPDGTLWLNEIHGIVCISAEEVRQVIYNPDHRITYQLYDFLDGMPGGPQMNFTVSTAIAGSDGKLWFATDNGLTWIDPANISKNPLPPPVAVRSLSVDEKIYAPSSPLELPQGTTNLRIAYTALSLSIPERVRFKYKLEAVDDHWQVAGARREAFYTNLGPGFYRFQVIASNNDGVWNETGANLEFRILPAFYQTGWFYLLCAAALGCIIWLAYRRHVRQVRMRLARQFEDRLSERTRVAQDLHDTLLQGLLSTSMQLHVADRRLTEDSPVKPQIKRVLEIMKQVIEEGRNTVRGLRSDGHDSVNLEQAFSLVPQKLTQYDQTAFRVVVEGRSRHLHPILHDEVFRIGHEALVNAYRHADARNIEVTVEYSDSHLRLVVSDDGQGIDSKVLKSGREGHWGLSGMSERAEKIGANLKVKSRAGAGTEIELIVPNHIAFKEESPVRPRTWFSKLSARKSKPARPEEEQKK